MEDFLTSTIKLFYYYKSLGDKTFEQLPDDKLFWQYNEQSNSIAIIVKHLHGNMLSRWTDFLTSDGEKTWRKRDAEFDNDIKSKEELLTKWNEGWACLLNALEALNQDDLNKTVYIRNMGHSVVEAINRQLAHYSSHVGQIMFLGKMIAGNNWQSLSITKGNSEKYNQEKFSETKRKKHFTDDL